MVLRSPRTIGPVSAASPCSRALSRAAVSSGRRVPAGSSAAGGGQHLHRLGDQRDQVVGAVGQTRVVERALSSGTHIGRPPRSSTSCCGELALRRRRRSGRTRSRRAGRGRCAVPVKVIAGCMATIVRAHGAGRLEHGEAVPAGGVHDVLALVQRAAGGQHRDDVGEHVVGDGSSRRSQARATALGLSMRTPGSSSAIRCREASDSPAAATISWPAARRRAARTAPTRPAPTTPTLKRLVIRRTFRSSPSDHPRVRAGVGTGRCVLVIDQRPRYADVIPERTCDVTHPAPSREALTHRYVDRRPARTVRWTPNGAYTSARSAAVVRGDDGAHLERAGGAGQPVLGHVVDDVHARRGRGSRARRAAPRPPGGR